MSQASLLDSRIRWLHHRIASMNIAPFGDLADSGQESIKATIKCLETLVDALTAKRFRAEENQPKDINPDPSSWRKEREEILCQELEEFKVDLDDRRKKGKTFKERSLKQTRNGTV